MATQVSVAEAKTHLSELIRRVESGKDVVVARAGRSVARLTGVNSGQRSFGLYSHQRMTDAELLAPMDEETWHCGGDRGLSP